jgi:pantoate--beta-alanine ligase
MDIFREIKPLKAFLREKRKAGSVVGFVPTMGALHQGHLSLLHSSQKNECFTVCSIFVNPVQFNNPDDLKKYPRTLEADIALLEQSSCDVLFIPDSSEIYPLEPITRFDFGKLDKIMEGEFRPGHFSGVALIVAKLFNIVEPDHAFFGQKDWQQFTIVRQLVSDLAFNVHLHAVPTLREADGLAMSSRNQRLTPEQRKNANSFYTTLLQSRDQLTAGNTMDSVRISAREFLEKHEGFRLEYLELVDRANLTPLKNVEEPNRAVLCIAGLINDIRLIDNILV